MKKTPAKSTTEKSDPAPPTEGPARGANGESELEYLRQVERALRAESQRRLLAERVVRKQNAALAGTRNVLTRCAAGRDFIPVFLRSMTRECNGVWATLWKVDARAEAGARAISFFPNKEIEDRVDEFVKDHAGDLLTLGKVYRSLADEFHETYIVRADDRRVPIEVQRFYERVGVANAVIAPCLLGNQLLGWFSLLTADGTVSAENVAFIHATAQQATLAMQLSQLAVQADKAEQAMEKERLARRREEEATEVTRLLRLTANSVDQAPGMESLFETALRNIRLLLRARTAGLWTFDADDETYSLALLSDAKTTRPPDSGERLTLERFASGPRRTILRDWSEAGDVLVRPVEDPEICRLRRVLTPAFRSAEDGFFFLVPLLFQDEFYGFIVAVGPTAPRPRSERFLAARALGVQIALAQNLDQSAGLQRLADLAEERNRIARDLHDLFAQALSGITLQVEAIRAEHPDLPAAVASRLERIRDNSVRSVEQVRRTLLLLRPEFLDEHTLPEALSALANDTRSATGLTVEFSNQIGDSELDSAVEINLFAIASEAIRNAVQHAHARSLRIGLRRLGGRVALRVTDDGTGLTEAGGPDSKPSGAGLLHIRERAAAIGGTVKWQSRRSGTTLEVTCPEP